MDNPMFAIIFMVKATSSQFSIFFFFFLFWEKQKEKRQQQLLDSENQAPVLLFPPDVLFNYAGLSI